MKIESYSISIENNGHVKSPTLWVQRKDKNAIYPLIYFRKPKWVDEDDFKKVLENIKLHLPQDFELKISDNE